MKIRERAQAAKARAVRLRDLERDNAAAGRLGNEAQYDLTKVSLAVQGRDAALELDPLAEFALRVTAPEMAARIAQRVAEVAELHEQSCDVADAIMALLTEGEPSPPLRTVLFWQKEEECRPVIRWNAMRGDWWLLNRRRAGWGERGYFYATLAEIVAAWACRIVGRAQDTHGEYLVIEEAPRDEAPQDVSAWEVTA